MKKIIFFILLDVLVSSLPVKNKKELEELLERIDYTFIEKVWEFIKQYAEKAIKFLKEIGLYDPIIELLQKYGRTYGIQYCTTLKIPEGICTSIIDFLLQFIK